MENTEKQVMPSEHFADLGGHGCEGCFGVFDETLAQEEVARWIPGDDEFRGDDQLGTLGDECAIGFEDAAPVSFEVADSGVELRETDFHLGRIPQKEAEGTKTGKRGARGGAGNAETESTEGNEENEVRAS